ncbi:helix-turn-helix domain-containing protein [Streptomyces sp. NBC_00069]|uniref:helix-turn-helix domain-containing protein n=1 Tax=Streptomyces sp. NBC_00069 TaxID=2975639 RepID=UPI0032536A3D
MITQTRELLTAAEVEERYGYRVGTLKAWRYLGKGPAYIPGTPVRYRVMEIERWLTAQTVTPSA